MFGFTFFSLNPTELEMKGVKLIFKCVSFNHWMFCSHSTIHRDKVWHCSLTNDLLNHVKMREKREPERALSPVRPERPGPTVISEEWRIVRIFINIYPFIPGLRFNWNISRCCHPVLGSWEKWTSKPEWRYFCAELWRNRIGVTSKNT